MTLSNTNWDRLRLCPPKRAFTPTIPIHPVAWQRFSTHTRGLQEDPL